MLSQMRIFTIILVFGACFLSGCATSRDVVYLATPTTGNFATSKGIEIYIRSVVDKRIFEAPPKSPDIPSLDPAEPENDTIKLRAIGRKRNTYGKALGDILLNEGQTVESVIYNSLRQAFIESGYTVIENNSNMSQSSQAVDVQINKFWSWMNPGFWAITLSTEIATDITVKKANEVDKKTIHVKAADNFQTGVEENSLSVMNSALKDYVSQVKAKFK
ncbi:MAG: YajG family lipoprotein [Candidatus Binatia bacterium]